MKLTISCSTNWGESRTAARYSGKCWKLQKNCSTRSFVREQFGLQGLPSPGTMFSWLSPLLAPLGHRLNLGSLLEKPQSAQPILPSNDQSRFSGLWSAPAGWGRFEALCSMQGWFFLTSCPDTPIIAKLLNRLPAGFGGPGQSLLTVAVKQEQWDRYLYSQILRKAATMLLVVGPM